MTPKALPLAALALLAEFVVLVQRPEALPLLPPSLHGAVLLLGILLAVGGALRPRAAARWELPAGSRARALPATLIVLASVLGVLEVARALRSPRSAPSEETVRAQTERDALRARSAFEELLGRERALVLEIPDALFPASAAREDLFARLDEFRDARNLAPEDFAVTLYGAAGEALAWSGDTTVLDPRDLRDAPLRGAPEAAAARDLRDAPLREASEGAAARVVRQFIHKNSLGTRLITDRTGKPGAIVRHAVSEVLLDAPFDPRAWQRRVRLPSDLRDGIGAEFLDPAQADASLGEFLTEGDDRYWKRGGAAGAELLVALRDDSRELLGLLTLQAAPFPAGPFRRAQEETILRAALLLAAAFIVLGLAVRSWRSMAARPSELLTVGLLLPGLRIGAGVLLQARDGLGSLFDYRLFAMPAPLALTGSPGDCLLSGLVVLGLAGLAAAAIRDWRLWSRRAALAVSPLLGAGLLFLTRPWINDSSLNLARSPFLAPQAPRLALAWSHQALCFSVLLIAAAALSPIGRRLSLKRVATVWLAACTLSYLLLAREAAKVPGNLIETSLAREVVGAKAEAGRRLLHVLADAASDPRWEPLGSAGREPLSRLLFDTWSESELGRSGARSALAILDGEGRPLASFAYGLPESVFDDTARTRGVADSRRDASAEGGERRGEAPDGARDTGAASSSPTLGYDELAVLSLRVPLLRGETLLTRGGQTIGRLCILDSAEWDNLPFLTVSDPLLRSLGAGREDRAFDEYFGGAPLFIAYSRGGEVLFPSAEQAAPLSPALLAAQGPVWTRTRLNGSDYRTYLFPTPDGPRAIGYASPSAVSVAAGTVRALIAGLPILALAVGVLLVLRLPRLRSTLSVETWGAFLGRSYYRRLLAVVLVSSLLPLLLLAVFFRSSIERRSREEFEQDGVKAAGTVRRLLEDYVESGAGTVAEPVPIGSRTLFWVGRTVHQDIHLFMAERLVATSRGGREASGLRTFRLNAEVARALALNRPPQFLAKSPGPGLRTTLVYAPVRLKAGAPDGILAVPLVLQERDLGREGEAVADALLTATFALGVLLSGIGYLFARRLSVPIRELAVAAGKIAEGQLSVRVHARGRDEIRQLVEAFNGMAAALSEQREDLRRRKDYIEAILLNVTTGVISTDAEGVVRTGNPAASLLLDLPVNLTGRNLFEELRRRPELGPVLELWSRNAPASAPAIPREVSLVRDGQEIRLRSVVLPLSESPAAPPGRIYLLEDVTEVMRSNRLAAWAEMARGIAHEIKNPLTPIQLSAEHLLRVRSDGRQDDDRVLRECVATILEQVRALREISSDFSAYARLPDLRREPSDLAEVVRATIAPYRTASALGVRIEEAIVPVPPISLDARVLRRALVNLVENALQAMDGGGVLRISVSPRTIDGAAFAEIEVADTGVGMDEATRRRIFEPYFSTRDAGIGLGLAIARRAVEEHGGTIAAESRAGEGTRMIIRLPIAETAPGDRPSSDRGQQVRGQD